MNIDYHETGNQYAAFTAAVKNAVKRHEEHYQRSLEEHLRSLWGIILKYQGEPPSYPLFARLIAEAFDVEPLPFDERWLDYRKPPFWDDRDGVLVIQEYRDNHWVMTRENVDDMEILTDTVLCQIADLHRMIGKQLNGAHQYSDIDSPAGNRWYNLDVETYWECATRGMLDHLRSSQSRMRQCFTHCTWASLAALLNLGQMYE